MKQINPLLPTLLVLQLLATAATAQTQALGLRLGLSNYQGDLVKGHVNAVESHVAWGVFYQKMLTADFTVRLGIDQFKISGRDANYADRIGRGLSFESRMLTASVMGQWNVIPQPRFDRHGEFAPHFTPVVFSGMGVVFFDPKVQGYDLDAPEPGRMGKNYNFFVPFGLGGHYDISPRLTAGLEVVTNLPFTDDLDGVCESGKAGNNDWFGLVTASAQYWIDQPQRAKKRGTDKAANRE